MNKSKDASTQQAVWRQSGCMLAESLVEIWKFSARLNFCVPPHARQAAVRWVNILQRDDIDLTVEGKPRVHCRQGGGLDKNVYPETTTDNLKVK